MSKKVIRLTESELKRYIKKIVAEQAVTPSATPSIPTQIPTTGGSAEVLKGLTGKTVRVYGGANSNLMPQSCIIKGASQGKNNVVYIQVDNKTTANFNYIVYDIRHDAFDLLDGTAGKRLPLEKGELYNWLKKNVQPIEDKFDFTSQNTNSPMNRGANQGMA